MREWSEYAAGAPTIRRRRTTTRRRLFHVSASTGIGRVYSEHLPTSRSLADRDTQRELSSADVYFSSLFLHRLNLLVCGYQYWLHLLRHLTKMLRCLLK